LDEIDLFNKICCTLT